MLMPHRGGAIGTVPSRPRRQRAGSLSSGIRPYRGAMAPFDRVVLIFNPNSTGDAKDKAAELRDELSVRVPQLPVELSATQHAGHARDLARDAARAGQPLL